MTESYFNLKRKLEDLGYNQHLPTDAVPLVECILADLLQTTRSLQHYMDLSKETISQRDKLILEVEPYKCDNANLVQDNNRLHKELMFTKEHIEKLSRDYKRQLKSLTEQVTKKDIMISKLQHDLRDLGLRGLCAGTVSSRIKCSKKEKFSQEKPSSCICLDNKIVSVENDLLELKKQIEALEELNHSYNDKIGLLKSQVDNRDAEISRLNQLLEGGRPVHAFQVAYGKNNSERVQNLIEQIDKLEFDNEELKKEIKTVSEKQHEAMLRAVNLADDNKYLKEELCKVDGLAMKVEEECNNKLTSMKTELNNLKVKHEELTLRNSQLERLSHRQSSDTASIRNLHESLTLTRTEKETLQCEVKELQELIKGLQEKIQKDKTVESASANIFEEYKCATKEDLQNMLEKERKSYEKHMTNLQDKLTDTIGHFENHLSWCRSKGDSPSIGQVFVNDLHTKLCESEQRILMLKKENDELQRKQYQEQDNSKQNYKDIINQLNVENSDLIKENLSLSRQISQYKTLTSLTSSEDNSHLHKNLNKLEADLNQLKHENEFLRKDKQEYKIRYKECLDQIESLNRNLVMKQKQTEQLEEENCSYKMTNRTGKASTDHLREEINFLREHIKRMQTDVIKEKTLASQMKNIQLETERSSYELQNELLSTRKQLSISNNDIESLRKRIKDLQDEIMTLKADKSNVISNIKMVDQERDQLVIELDKKTEILNAMENKTRSQSYEIEKYEKEINDLKQNLSMKKIAEHKLEDNDAQIRFLNSEISRLNRQFDNAIIENRQLQNSLADANGSLKITKIEYEKSRKEVDGLKQQLQHYVAEIRRIEELLSQKEAERSDMLEHFASLTVEANMLENNNHSLENESASKSAQLQSYISKISDLENKIMDRENEIDTQAAKISAMSCKITTLEREVKLINEEKEALEKNVEYLKKMCNSLKSEKSMRTKGIDNTDSELKLYETKMRHLSTAKVELQSEKMELKETLQSTEKLLSNARKEVIDLKLALQDATAETKILQDKIHRLQQKNNSEFIEVQSRDEFELPLTLEETIHEISHEEDEDSSRFHEVHKRISKYTHSGTI